jgi:hypothetical protein
MWKPTAQDGLWIQGGNLMQARFHSLHLALQLKARMEGLRCRFIASLSILPQLVIDLMVPGFAGVHEERSTGGRSFSAS